LRRNRTFERPLVTRSQAIAVFMKTGRSRRRNCPAGRSPPWGVKPQKMFG
jgi:hypothetical protein